MRSSLKMMDSMNRWNIHLPIFPTFPKEDILKRIQEGGVVGQGGAGFPTHVKLSPKEPDKIDHILITAPNDEHYIQTDYRRMMEEPESVVGGLEVILKAFPKAVGCICIEDNKPDCIARMKEAIKGKERMEVKELKTKYPQGGEAYIDLCGNRQRDQFHHASGRRRMRG